MIPTVQNVLRAFLYRKVRPWWWRRACLPRLSRLVDAQLASVSANREGENQLFESLLENSERGFYFGKRNRKDFFLHLLTQSQSRDSIVAEGDAVLGNSFEVFGSGRVALGETIDWQRDFLSGHRWPLVRLHTQQILDLGRPSDIKVPWELGRFHQVWWLGKAYWITNNEEYARKFGSLVEEWIRNNPIGRGVHWAVAMEASIRACNWVCGFAFFAGSSALSSDFWERFAHSLFAHGLFIWNNREVSLRNGNHYLSNIIALLFLGMFFRGTPLGHRWTTWALGELEREMDNQVTVDGVNYEKSTAYHRLVLEFFTAAAVLCKVNALPLSPPFWDRLNAMFRFTAASTRPDGSVPQIGDCDDGRLFRYRMIDSVHDHRHLLSVGSVLFQNGLFKSVSGGYSQDALFLLGAEGFEDFMKISEQPQTALSEEFVEGGYVVLRAPHVHITVDVGDIGMRGRGGHGHNDTLSFELWAYGQGFIVDRGTYTYTGDTASRQDFRSTHAHNTIVIDDNEIADFEGLWAVRKDATVPRVLERSFGSERDLLVAEHSGYSGLPDPVTHRRRMEFHKTEHMVKITDELIGQASHDVALRFHIHPDIACVSDSPGVWRLKGRNADILLQTQAPLVQTQSWYSPSYGIRLHMVVLVSEQRLQLPTQITTMIRVIPHTP